ncbi:MAG TPA: hypothetical protein VMY35_14370 [Phycisphaerae bacterium]|nr:hypothetical protein [Phycisphaerae bacterium]
MAWDPAVNHTATLMGATIEFGEATLASGTIEVPTRLSKVLAGFATYKAVPAAATKIVVDCTITSGAVTVASAAGGDKKVNYLFIGLT